MKSVKNIKQLIKKFHVTTNAKMDQKIREDVLEVIRKSKQKQLAATAPNIWRVIMKSPITKLAALAVIIITCVTGLYLWKTTSSGIALADVLARVEQSNAFRSKVSVTINPGKPDGVEFRGRSMMSREYGYKHILEVRDPNGGWEQVGERYFYPQNNTIFQIGHPIKTYFRWEVDDAEAQQQQEFLGQNIDPSACLRDIMACKYEKLGRFIINGIDVEGFRTTDPNYRSSFSRFIAKDPQVKVDVKIWVDAKTRLPVRYEEHASGLDEMGNPGIMHEVWDDFEWDVSVTPAEFEPPAVPDGYAVVNSRPEPSDEEAVIQGLRQCVALFGNYLETIDNDTKATELIFLAIEKSETPAALRLKKRIKELAEDKKLERVKSAGWPLRRLIWFYIRLVQDKKDPAYYGKTVTPKDSDKVLLRWKLSENKYRVIYGDLHTETVSGERLAELENPVRQPRVKATPTPEQETSPAIKAGNIIWVSDAFDQSGDGKPDDQAWVDMLRGWGYTVDYTKGASPSKGYWRTLDNDKVTALNAADLIIVSRCTGSGFYDNDDESKKWNSVKTPMILLSAYFTRQQCWSWLDTRSPAAALWPGRPPSHSDVSTLMALEPHHPIFKDVQLDSKNQVKIFDQTAGSGKVSFNPIADVGNGTLIAKPANQDWTFIAEWEPGSEFYPGAGQTPAGRRMIFAAGTIEWAAGGCGRGEYNLNAQGEKLFINMIEYMLGNLVRQSRVKVIPTTEQESSPAIKAGNIIWVSDVVDQSGDGKPDDQAWADMLKSRGYTVDYTKGVAPKKGYWRILDNDKVAALNAADLIIVSRCIGPTSFYVKDGESTKWNSVKTPMILLHTYFARRQCWSWLDTRSPSAALWPGRPPSHSDVSILLALVPHHPIFKDVQLDSKKEVKIFDQTVGSGKVSFNPIADVGNGTLIAKPANQDWTFIAEWEPGSEFYPGAGQTPGGRRMIFAAGTIEWAAAGCGRGEYNLNAQGEKLFINMIEYMIGNLE